ncbi:unnamed protein product, partial [Symbiodinium microadriaticum]
AKHPREDEEEEEEEEFEMQLGPVKTANLMLGGVGLDWEVIWIWLAVALSTDVLGYNFRAVPAAIMKRQISWTDPAISIVMSVFPVLGPRVDLLKERLFADRSVFQPAAHSRLLDWKCRAPHLLPAGAGVVLVRNDQGSGGGVLAGVPAKTLPPDPWLLVARLWVSNAATGKQERPPEQTTWEWLAILAVIAMVVFQQYSGMLLVNLVISGCKILAVFILGKFIWHTELYFVDLVRVHQVELGVPDALSHDPVTFAAFAVSCGRSEEVLLQVATDGWADYVAALLSAGADKAGAKKDSKHTDGYKPLHIAAREGRADCVELLLKAGAENDAEGGG